jgi:hypothetical protein
LSCWSEWARSADSDLLSIDARLATSARIFRGSRTARAPQGAPKLFATYLREEGILPPMARASRPDETWPGRRDEPEHRDIDFAASTGLLSRLSHLPGLSRNRRFRKFGLKSMRWNVVVRDGEETRRVREGRVLCEPSRIGVAVRT